MPVGFAVLTKAVSNFFQNGARIGGYQFWFDCQNYSRRAARARLNNKRYNNMN